MNDTDDPGVSHVALLSHNNNPALSHVWPFIARLATFVDKLLVRHLVVTRKDFAIPVTPTILIVDDEQDLATTMQFALEQNGWSVKVANDGASALLALGKEPRPDLVLLDLMLPDISGTEICRRMRSDPHTRDILVVMVTAMEDEIDRVVGFEVGADDYVTKPFSMRELLLRIKALLRRSGPSEAQAPVEQWSFSELKIDPVSHQVWVSGLEVALTALEFKLLSTFVARRGSVQTREVLLRDVWGHTSELTTRTIDTHVQRLRKKLGVASAYVETLRGVGYRFMPRSA